MTRREELFALATSDGAARPDWSRLFPSMLTLEEFRVRYPRNGVLLVGHCVDDLAERWDVSAEMIARAIRHCSLASLTDVVTDRKASVATANIRTVWFELATRVLIIREVPIYREQVVTGMAVFAITEQRTFPSDNPPSVHTPSTTRP